MLCIPSEDGGRCKACGVLTCVGVSQNCPAVVDCNPDWFANLRRGAAAGLGDYTERVLKKLGVTEERYKEVKKKFGLAPACNCKERKEWLNKIGRWLTG